MSNDSEENSFTSSFDSWTSDRKSVDTQLEYQVDMGSAQNINSPKYSKVAQQTASREVLQKKLTKSQFLIF